MEKNDNHDIASYRPSPDDAKLFNPYLAEVMEIISAEAAGGAEDPGRALSLRRADLVQKYAFAIPTAGVLRAVAEYSTIVEIGAGSGYWAMCLSALGVEVAAYDWRVPGDGDPWDIMSLNQWFDDVWYPVEDGDESYAGYYPGHTLLLCWPPLDNPMASRALQAHRAAGGNTVIFIGDPEASGDQGFHEALGGMRRLAARRIPGWPGFREEIVVARYR